MGIKDMKFMVSKFLLNYSLTIEIAFIEFYTWLKYIIKFINIEVLMILNTSEKLDDSNYTFRQKQIYIKLDNA